ncbi:MAG: GNAT family N-acetyltransferase [Coprobacillaceae bacterium]
MIFRKALPKDIQQIMYIIEEAKIGLLKQGINQWQNGYPNKESILEDILHGDSYVLEDNHQIVATCMISNQPDPNYSYIEDGTWLQDKSYSVIHRIAMHPNYKGRNIASKLIDKVFIIHPSSYSIRVDTHLDNISMQKVLKKNGFDYCGIIYVSDGTARNAYEKIKQS